MLYPLILVMIMWLVYLFNLKYGWNLEVYGLKPHSSEGFIGIFSMPFLHENLEHIFSNTVPILVAGGFMFYYFKEWTWAAMAAIWIGTGVFLWFVGKEGTIHIGASGLVYGFVFFLLFSGFLRNNRELSAVALLMVFLYGGIMWGLFPDYIRLTGQNISWEGHMGGAIMGILMAVLLLKKGPANTVEQIEEDEDDPFEYPYWLEGNEIPEENNEKENGSLPDEPVQIKYRYIPKNGNPWEKDDPY